MKCSAPGVLAVVGCLLGGLLGGLGLATPAAAMAPEPEPIINIEIVPVDLPDTRAEIAPTVAAELQRLIALEPELPPGVVWADDRELFLELLPGPIPGQDDVLVRVEVRLDGEVVAESATETCLSCTNEQVAEKAMPMLRPLLTKLPEPPPPPAPKIVERTAADEPGEAAPERARPQKPLLIAGASLLGAGVAGLGAGIALIVIDERVVSEPGAAMIETIDYRTPGIAVTVGGGLVAVTGATLLGLSFRRRSPTKKPLAAAPIVDGERWGLAIAGRF